MNQANQGNNPDSSADTPVKRKRGRPRKYPKLNIEENVRVLKDQNLNRGENVHVPPGFEGVNGNHPRQVDPIDNATDMVGQVVSGVIEAAFDAGYLLSVRVGSSGTTLRGVVFKPGRYAPVSTENDVAPDIQMIRRNDIPLPSETYTQVHSHNPQSVKSRRNGSHPFNESPIVNQDPRVAPYSPNLVASKGKQVPSVAAQTTHPAIPRGNVVPVVLQPVNLPNGSPLANQPSPVAIEAAPLTASKRKQVLAAAHLSDGSTPNQVPTVRNQAPPSQPQSIHQVTPKGAQSENGTSNQPPAEVLPDVEGKSLRFPVMPFEKLLTEVSKRSQVPSESAETEIESTKSAGKTSVKDSGHHQEDVVSDMDQPLFIEPLQAVQPDLHNHSESASKPFENIRTGKMTELLQALQENAMESQVPQAGEPATTSGLKSD